MDGSKRRRMLGMEPRAGLAQLFVLLALACTSDTTSGPASRPKKGKAGPADWSWAAKDFAERKLMTVAVMPMMNLAIDVGAGEILHCSVYENLKYRGYCRTSAKHVREALEKAGMPELEAPNADPAVLREYIKADAFLKGAVEQHGKIKKGVYHAAVATIELQLVDAKKGDVIWKAGKRVAKRRWSLDPVNMLWDLFRTKEDKLDDRIEFLVQQLLGGLPKGPVKLVKPDDNWLGRAKQAKSSD